MLFNSFRFLIFFPCVFLLYYALPFRWRKYMLLAASYYFYMCWRADFIFLIVISTCIDYFCGLGIEKHRANKRVANTLLGVSMCMNLGLLFFFKYLNFFGESLNAVFRLVAIPFSVPMLHIILPVGISFYTFQTMSYTIDVWRGKMKAEPDFVTFALFVSYFPQLVAGPIERATNLLPQLKEEHPFRYENAAYGAKLMLWGFFKKLVIADRLGALFVDPVYNDLATSSGGAILIATAAFAFQIYCDFGGYSDIARGCAKMMGIDLVVNFKQPYLCSNSVAEYWKRWHISLGNWLEDYLFEPLTWHLPSRHAAYWAVTAVFFASGLWHGASWTFVLWGMMHAAYRLMGMATRKTRRKLYKKLGIPTKSAWFKAGQTAFTFVLVCFSYIFFRANSMADALYAVGHCLAGITAPLAYCREAWAQLNPGGTLVLITLLTFLMLMAFDFVNEKRDTIQVISAWPAVPRWGAYIGFTLMVVLLIPKALAAPFIYFQF